MFDKIIKQISLIKINQMKLCEKELVFSQLTINRFKYDGFVLFCWFEHIHNTESYHQNFSIMKP